MIQETARKLPFKALPNEFENKLLKSNEPKNNLRGAQQLSVLAVRGLGPSTILGGSRLPACPGDPMSSPAATSACVCAQRHKK